ncbi:hypothetical protein CVIRNUC_008140 [Coccomyxa viridis]|uniref:Sugar phosphate transporter domain-containing protein n=1 Tax=Coccomyxa viridis TaxID=1274662 RepID=A0AAV1IFA8_9CHLO|nr:hypothetical protein CVIRNUC_008140 [Coccomyxa viridis]
MGFAEQRLVMDLLAWAGNVSSSVLIIFVNKILMNTTGYGFQYATTLCALHYMACSVSIWTTQALGGVKKVTLPFADLLLFTATANLSIVSLNLSLMLNRVGFYQIAKLLIIPFVCGVESVWLGKVFSRSIIASIFTVVAGVAIVTITDLEMENNVLGTVIAAISVVSSGMQQIFCRTMQQKHSLASHELLANTAPAQAWTLLLLGPFLDRYISHAWVFNYDWNVPALTFLALSCACAVGVNVSQFMCLGRFSAVSYQVLGHSKTMLVLLGGWAFLGDHVSLKQLAGMALAVIGMVLYGVASSQKAAVKETKPEKQALLGKGGSEGRVDIQVMAGQKAMGMAGKPREEV